MVRYNPIGVIDSVTRNPESPIWLTHPYPTPPLGVWSPYGVVGILFRANAPHPPYLVDKNGLNVSKIIVNGT